jgi:hypothetical protein
VLDPLKLCSKREYPAFIHSWRTWYWTRPFSSVFPLKETIPLVEVLLDDFAYEPEILSPLFGELASAKE